MKIIFMISYLPSTLKSITSEASAVSQMYLPASINCKFKMVSIGPKIMLDLGGVCPSFVHDTAEVARTLQRISNVCPTTPVSSLLV